MASHTKPAKPQGKAQTAAQAVPAAQAANPAAGAFGALVAATVAAPVTVQVPAVAVQVPATFAGVPYAQLPKSNQALATAKAPGKLPVLPPALTIVGAKPYRVGKAHTAQWFAALCTAGCASPAGATPAQIAALVPGTVPAQFVTYALRNKWLVPATAS